MAVPPRRRSTLFAGALAPEALAAALAAGADLVCIDLEDAVPPERKPEGRQAVLRWLAGSEAVARTGSPALVARINPLTTPEGREDLEALAAAPGPLAALMLPKVESPEEIAGCAARLREQGSTMTLFAIIETPLALERAFAIAQADPLLQALFFGGFDLSAALGCEMAWEPLLYARSRVVHAAAGAGIDCIDSPYPRIDDPQGLLEACARVRALGMTGKAAKSAAQVAAITDAFSPTPAECERARRILAAFEADPTRPLWFEGRLYERPALRRLRALASFGPG